MAQLNESSTDSQRDAPRTHACPCSAQRRWHEPHTTHTLKAHPMSFARTAPVHGRVHLQPTSTSRHSE
jgi:hypothetical protein